MSGTITMTGEEYDALHAEVEALRADSQHWKGMHASSMALRMSAEFERDELRTELDEARGLLAQLRGMINCTPENDIDRTQVWISTKHPLIERIDAFLTAHLAQEVPDHTERNLEMVERGGRSE